MEIPVAMRGYFAGGPLQSWERVDFSCSSSKQLEKSNPMSIRLHGVKVSGNIWLACLNSSISSPCSFLHVFTLQEILYLLYCLQNNMASGAQMRGWIFPSNLSQVSEQLCSSKHSSPPTVINNAPLSFFGVIAFIKSPMSKD